MKKKNAGIKSLFCLITIMVAFLTGFTTAADITDSHPPEDTRPSPDNLLTDLKAGDPEVRERAAELLGKAHDESAVEGLIFMLSHDDVWSARKSAAWALGEIRDKRALVPLMRSLGHSDWIIRFKAAEALGKLGDGRAVAVLIDSLQDENDHVRVRVIWALGEIGAHRAVEPLINAMDNEIPDIRINAAAALGKIKDGSSLDALMKVLRADRSWEVRKWAAWALGEIKDVRASEALVNALSDDNYYVRLYAELSLEKIGGPATPLLVAALKEKDVRVRTRAAWALEGITGKDFGPDVGAWEKWLSDREGGVPVKSGE